MDVFVFAGSTIGATRTSSSILLAAGAKSLGFKPLHIQVLIGGGFPSLVDVKRVPFATSTIKAEAGERITERVRARVRKRPGCSPVIIDMPAQDVFVTLLMFSGMHPRVLVPLPRWAADPKSVVLDFRRIQEHRQRWAELNRQAGRIIGSDQPSIWLFPVGWPSGIGSKDLMTELSSHDLLPPEEPEDSVLYPGLPRFDPRDMDFADGDDRFALSKQQLNAAARIVSPICGDPE